MFMNTDSEWDKVFAGENNVARIIDQRGANGMGVGVHTGGRGRERSQQSRWGQSVKSTCERQNQLDAGGAHHVHRIINKLDIESACEHKIGWV